MQCYYAHCQVKYLNIYPQKLLFLYFFSVVRSLSVIKGVVRSGFNKTWLDRVPRLPSIMFDVSMLSLLNYSLSLCFFVATFITFFFSGWCYDCIMWFQ